MELIKYSINAAEIAKMSDIYMGLTVKSLDDEEGLAAVHSARMIMVKHRVGIDKLRKSSNEDAQAFIRNNNNNAKKLLVLLEPIEMHLKNEEGKVEAEKARIKEEEAAAAKEKIQARVNALFAVNVVLPFQDVALCSDAEYEDKLILATDAYRTEQQRIAEEQRIKKEEEAKLAIERAEIERIKAEQDARAREQAEKEEALKEQERAIETAKRKEIERQEQIAWREREAERLRILAEANAAEKIAKAIEDAKIAAEEIETARLLKEVAEKERVEREAREKIEAEKAKAAEKARKLELAPDKDKLSTFTDKIQELTAEKLNLKSKAAQNVFAYMIDALLNDETTFRVKIDGL